MHKLLKRQLLKQFGSLERVPPEISVFLASVDQAYRSADEDRELHTRSLEITSEELMEKNRLLRAETEEIRQIVSVVPEGLAIAREEKFLFVNTRFASFLEYEADELAGTGLFDLVEEEDHPILVERIRDAEKTGTNKRAEIRFRSKSGRAVLLEFSPARRIRFESAPAVLMASRDVTDRKRDEARALLAGRMAAMGTLTAGIAHEINNPLAYVLSNLSFVTKELSSSVAEQVEIHDALRDALDGAERVRRIVRDLKSFSRPDDDTRGPVALDKVVEDAVKLTGAEIRTRARLVVSLEATSFAEGNEARIAQVLVNLLVNAAHATPEGAADRNEIRILTRNAGDRVVLEVTDTGTGMSEEVRAKIFDPFFTTKPIGVGTGLGLSICHGIIAALSGTIEVESELGKGTTFRISLPARDDSPAVDSAPLVVPPVLTGRVLVVDDEPMIGIGIKRMLRGHQVTSVQSGAEALVHLRRGDEFDVILCDLMMPGMTGMELYERLPVEAARRVVFMTGGAFTPNAAAFVGRVANETLEKPFEPEALNRLVGRRLGVATKVTDVRTAEVPPR